MNKYFMMLVIIPTMLVAQSDLKGEATITLDQAWDSDGNPQNQTGLRYIPTWSAGQPQSYRYRLDMEIAGNFSFYKYPDESGFSLKGNWARLHRSWIRLTTDRFEARLGLQKITFGPARLFRPLAWFDTIDPRDPHQYTAGANGLRLRYDFPNNAGIWLWGLYNEFDLRAITEDNIIPDLGGRLVYPMGPGEIGLAYHHSRNFLKERGYGIDGVWDIGIGLWFELGMINVIDVHNPDWESQLTVGTDYTFGIGNGITLSGEYFLFDYSEDIFGNETRANLLGLMGSYPLNIMDILSLFSIYSPDSEFLYNYVSWQRTYDNWLVQISAFILTGEEISVLGSAMSTVGTKGLQINLIYNH